MSFAHRHTARAICLLCVAATVFTSCDAAQRIIGLPVLDGDTSVAWTGTGREVTAQQGKNGAADADSFCLLCANGSARQIKATIKRGGSVNAIDGEGFSPMFYAVLGNPALYRDAVEKMREALIGDNDDAFYVQKDAAQCTRGNIDAVRVLVKNGADVHLTDRNKHTVFLYASFFCNDVNVLKELVKAGAHISETISLAHSNSLLSLSAALNPSAECVKYLADVGGGINDKNNFGTTPIMWAAMYQSNCDVLDTLIERGADINDRSHKDGYTPLYWARRCNRNPQVIEHIRTLGGKMLCPKSTTCENTKFAKLYCRKVFVGQAQTDAELDTLVRAAHKERGTQYDAPTLNEVKTGFEGQVQYDSEFRATGGWESSSNMHHATFTYNEIKQMIDRFCLSVDDEGAVYYVVGANTKPYFYKDKAGKLHYKVYLDDHLLSDNPYYHSSSISKYSDERFYYRYRYYDKSLGVYDYRDPELDFNHGQGYVFVYEIATGAIFSDYQNGGWQ